MPSNPVSTGLHKVSDISDDEINENASLLGSSNSHLPQVRFATTPTILDGNKSKIPRPQQAPGSTGSSSNLHASPSTNSNSSGSNSKGRKNLSKTTHVTQV